MRSHRGATFILNSSVLLLRVCLCLLFLLVTDKADGAFTQNNGSTVHHKSPVYTAIQRQESKFSSPRQEIRNVRSAGSPKSASNMASFSSPPNSNAAARPEKFNHVLAILTMPYTSMDRIANEAVLYKALQHTSKLSIVLKCEGGKAPSLASLRRYVGEVYSQLWDFAMATEDAVHFNDVVVYPQNLPNTAAEQWIYHLPDLDAICSHDTICGWISEGAQGRGTQFQYLEGDGVGGIDTHVKAVNSDRLSRDLPPVQVLHVDHWPLGASSQHLQQENVLFVDDDIPISGSSIAKRFDTEDTDEKEYDNDRNYDNCLIGGANIPENCLYNCVAVGGTFDGMHYGHRKLLTLAVSSVTPVTGKLMVGVTVDEMLQGKQFAEYIPPLKERMQGVKDFLHRLAPGMKNRIMVSPITDSYGPPGKAGEGKYYDALALSHETLETGVKLNRHRQETLGYDPLTLLCTRRTEAYGMSSTTLRKLKSLTRVDSPA